MRITNLAAAVFLAVTAFGCSGTTDSVPAAIGGDDTEAPVATSTGPTTTPASAPTTTSTPPSPPATDAPAATTAPPTTAPTSAPASALPGVEAHTVLLRYDGDTGAGTIEVVICNDGSAIGDEVSVRLLSPVEHSLAVDGAVLPRTCHGFSDPATDFATLGITTPGPHIVTVEYRDGNGVTTGDFPVEIDQLTIAPDPVQFADYQACVARGEVGCADRVRYQPVDGEVLKRTGHIQSIAPASVEGLATYSVLSQQNCAPRVEEYLGIQSPRPISHRFLVSDYVGGYTAPQVSWTTSAPLADHQESHDIWLATDWQTVIEGRCSPVTAHELTHLALGDTPITAYLNEGLATWMEITERSNGSNTNPNVECHDDAWFGWDIDLGADNMVPYSDLTYSDQTAPGIYHYYTGMCFWDWIDTTYGTEAVLEIVRTAHSYHDPSLYNGCRPGYVQPVLLVRDIINPIVGEDVSPVTDARFGIGLEWTGCEDVT